MKILLVTDAYPPEIRSASHLMFELAQGLKDRGHQVSVVTSWPQYNLEDGANISSILPYQVEEGITVLRIKTLPHHKVAYILRGISQLLLPFFFIRKIKKHKLDKPDVVMVYTPPLPLARVGAFLKKRGARFILNVQDLFPQNAIDLGVLNNSFLISFFRRMERQAYTAADLITGHSEGNTKRLQTENPRNGHKFITLHNWVDIASYQASENQKDFRTRFGFQGKFIAVFAGVVGPSQALDFVISAMARLQHYKDLVFLIVGDGGEKARLVDLVRDKKISNVMFQPFISRQDYPALLACSDVGIVSLSAKNKTPVVPGKILGYMAASLPVLAFLNKESDGHEIIASAACGYSVVSDNVDNALACIEKMYHNKDTRSRMGAAGFQYVSHHFSRDVCFSVLERLLLKEHSK
jgi:colanic acid biosynthesis glycosyl transferase WcaI